MTTTYTPWLHTDTGEPLAILSDYYKLTYTNRISGSGWFSLIIPADTVTLLDTPIADLLSPDVTIRVWRRPNSKNAYPELDFFGFVRKWKFSTSNDGVKTLELSGPDQNELLKRRISGWYAGSPQSRVVDKPAGEAMADVVYYNLGAGASSNRDITSNNFTIADATLKGPDITFAFAWKNLYKILDEMVDMSRTEGSEIFWQLKVLGIADDGMPILEFIVYDSPPGGDFSGVKGYEQVVFSLEAGNLTSPSLIFDYVDDRNVIHVGGPGEGASRDKIVYADWGRYNASIWNYRELFVDARNATSDELISIGKAKMNEHRPKVYMSGTIIDTNLAPYRRAWELGSKVTIRYGDFVTDAIIRNVTISVNGEGEETIHSKIELEDYL